MSAAQYGLQCSADETESFRSGMRAVQEAWTGMCGRLTEENANLTKAVEDMRRENGGLQRRLQTSEREVMEGRQQCATLARQLEELGNHNKMLSAQVAKWKQMTQTFQRMFTESGVEDDFGAAPGPGPGPGPGLGSLHLGSSFTQALPIGAGQASPTHASFQHENGRNFANYSASPVGAGTGAGAGGVDVKSFLASVRERLSPSEAKAMVELVKTLRFSPKEEVLAKAKSLLTEGDEDNTLLNQLVVICDRSCSI